MSDCSAFDVSQLAKQNAKKKVMLLAGVVPSAPFFKFLTIHIIIILTSLKKSSRY